MNISNLYEYTETMIYYNKMYPFCFYNNQKLN